MGKEVLTCQGGRCRATGETAERTAVSFSRAVRYTFRLDPRGRHSLTAGWLDLRIAPRGGEMSRYRFAPRTTLMAWVALAAVPALGSCSGNVEKGGPGGAVSGGTPGSGVPSGMGGGSPGNGPGQPGPSSGIIASSPGPSSRLIRLNHTQWENTVRDLFRLPQRTGLSEQFISDTFSTTFDNSGGSAEVPPQLWSNYRRAADELGKRMSRDAAALAALIPQGAPADPAGRARAFVVAFGRRAYRRPLVPAEIDRYVALFNRGPELVASNDAFADGVELVLATMLQSPHFLYRIEVGAEKVSGGKILLSSHEVASRLSYALTNTMPDDALFALADAKQLNTPAAVHSEARRLLDSPGGKAAVRDMYDQLSREIDPSELTRDVTRFPAFVPGVGRDMKRERELFVEEVIFGLDGGLKELLTAPFTFVNARLASLYGVPAPAGSAGDFRKVNLDPAQRGGLYTQLGFLSRNANDDHTQPILRGVHLNRHVLCVVVPPPPPNVDTEPPPVTAATTTRQHFEQLTAAPECQGCHGQLINPLGFAFENYDSLGRFRAREGNLPIDAAASYPFRDGKKSFKDALELSRLLAASEEANECYARHLFSYFYAREPVETSAADRALVTEVARRSREGASTKSIILDLVATDAFIHRLQ